MEPDLWDIIGAAFLLAAWGGMGALVGFVWGAAAARNFGAVTNRKTETETELERRKGGKK